jgi:probable O-glycosylation ligase (exosortase A-associated)
MLVIALSLGFEAAKQGWLQLILNPGAQNINELTAIGDNNGVAVAMYVLVAFLIALGRTASTKKETWLHRFLAAGSLYRGIATYSRGGFLAGGAVGLFYIARSKRRFRAVLALVVLAVMIAPVLPDEFWARMGTIRTAFSSPDPESEELDVSSRGRLYFWQVAREMAADRPFLGIGHNAYTQAYDAYDRSNGEYGQNRSVHSTWMGTLAELGYPGLALLIVNMGMAWLACRRARRLKGDSKEHVQLREFANALEISLVAIAVGGTFVIFQYTELLWHVLGLSIALQRLATRAVEAPAVAPPVVRHPMIAARPVVVSRSV